jgi:hypothetical protein
MRISSIFTTSAAVLLFALPAGVRAQAVSVCKDGTTSSSTGQGTCSGHGGVDKDKTAAAAKSSSTSSTSASSGGTVMCTDGTSSKGGRGACSGHGGIAKAGAAPAAAAAAAPAAAPAPAPAAAPAAPAAAPAASKSKSSKSASTGGSGEAVDMNPAGATAKCKDGEYSHSKHHSGACSSHGGVAQWLDGSTP